MEELKQRWINILRLKASEYEHEARKRGETICQPDIDSICNEMEAFFVGINFNKQ